MTAGLAVCIPEADPVIGDIRADHDRSASEGLGAHVTILFPFMRPSPRPDPALTSIFARHEPFITQISRIDRFAETIYLVPDPAAPFLALTQDIADAFPDWPPYGGAFAEIIPHLTVTHGGAANLDAIEPILVSRLRQPITSRVTDVTHLERVQGRWNAVHRYALGG